jgi:DNA-binding Lrp family transcriptional regulator
MEAEIEKIGKAIPAEDIFQLPATKLFKIGAFFGDGAEPETAHDPSQPGEESGSLTAEDRAVINAVQRDLPMTANPFAEMARDAGMDVTDFLIAVRALQERGLMRRYSAAVNHRRAGYAANGMACFAVPAERQDEVGEFLANQREVSHCYIRRTNPHWNYNLFAMIHGKEKDVALGLAQEVVEKWDIKDYGVLFSTREIKKMRIRYPV